MNIDDVKDVEIPEGNLLEAIFRHQHDLALKYVQIERKNGFFKPNIDSPPSINDPQFQNWIKNMFWRVTEEIAEAMEEIPEFSSWKEDWDNNHVIRHFFEELADAMHFLVEVSLVVKVAIPILTPPMEEEFEDVVPIKNEMRLKLLVWQFILHMGLAANCLKNKPWKESHMPTDVEKFANHLELSWQYFGRIWASLGCSMRDVYILYCKKNLVNQFRQNTNY